MTPFVRASFKKLAWITAILVVATIVVYLLEPTWIHPGIPLLFALFIGLSVGATFLAQQAQHQDPQMATTFYLGIMTGRLVISIIVLALFLLIDRTRQIVFIGNFFTLYLSYAVFDITGLVANLRSDLREH